MKALQTLVTLVLVLGTLAIPSLAQESEIGNRDVPAGMSPQLREIVYGRDGFSGFGIGALEAQSAGTSVDTPAGTSVAVWGTIYGRDGFDFYASAIERSRAVVRGMPAELRRVISSRDGFDVYAANRLTGGSSDLRAAKPDAMPAAVWQIITGRDGFGFANTCEVC